MSDIAGRVSIITIFFNEERFLAESIESVLSQTYGDWELLLCDDGSTDGSTAIALGYAQAHHGRIHYLEHPTHANRGMSATRNLGLANATGEFVAFLDGDDTWTPRKLETQVALLRAHPGAAMVYGPSLLWYSWSGLDGEEARDAQRPTGVPPGVLLKGDRVLRTILRGHATSPTTCGMLIRRNVVTSVGGFEDAFRGMYEDQAFFAKVLLHHSVLATAECHDRYRQHPDSACAIALQAGDYSLNEPNPATARYLGWLDQYLARYPSRLRLRCIVRGERWFYRHPSAMRVRGRLQSGFGTWSGRLKSAVFTVGRAILPLRVRHELWRRWVNS